jgi:hypothetical protein
MINFDVMRRLMKSARRPIEGKPLNKERSLGVTARGRNMHNARLFKHSDDEYSVELYRHTIATITKINNAALVTVDSVDSWPTGTTAERLTSILGTTVLKRDNKLRVWGLKNMTTAPQKFPPLANGMSFLVTKNGLYCVNPELMSDTGRRYVGDKAKAKEIKRWLNETKKLMTVQAKMGLLTWTEAYDSMEAGKGRTFTCYGKPVDQDVVNEVLAWFGFQIGSWRVADWAKKGRTIDEDYVKTMCTRLKERLYRDLGVYTKDTIDFASCFSKVDIHELSL